MSVSDVWDAPTTKPEVSAPPTNVRYLVLLSACLLAVVTYILRVGFATVSPKLEGALGLNAQHLGYLMAAFMIAYGIFEMPWGLIGDKLGVRTMLVVVAAGGALMTLAVAGVAALPAATIWPLVALVILRFLFGAFQAGTFPGISRMMADWMPTTERGSAQGLIWMSSRLGGSLAPLLLVPFFKSFRDWSTPLVLASGLGLVWCLAFWPWFRNRPEQMRWVNEAERARITAGRSGKPSAGHAQVPWRRMLTSGNVWALCLMYGFLGYSGNFYLTMLPKYLTTYRHLDDDTTKWLSSLPFACGVVGCVIGGVLSDVLIRRMGHARWGRRAIGATGLAVASVAFLSTLAVRDTIPLGFLLCLTFFGNDLAMGPAWAAAADIGERYTGTLSGMMNMMASFFGAAGALVSGALFEQGSLTLPFVLFSASYALGVLCWLRLDVTQTLADDKIAVPDLA
jgi:ACS family glucarate transporter-like MFS transporter